jgi:hypothetical protein
VIPSSLPHGKTARRLEWSHLPPHVRTLIERRCGSPVASATSQTSGFTPGFASVLTCDDGSRHFVKAASVKAQRPFAEAYREEARKLTVLPTQAPAPRLLWTSDTDDWVVLGLEYVDSRAPRRPWRRADLDAVLDVLESAAGLLTPPPDGMLLDSFADEFAAVPGYWEEVRDLRPDLPHVDAAAALAVRIGEVSEGSTLVHTDVRDDNVLLRSDGPPLLCDWNFPCVGAPWLDTLFLLVGPRGDGMDVETVLTERRLTRDLPAESIDIVLALLVGYFFRQCEEPVPPTSPYVREVQRWQGEVCWDWLSERRGWR